MIEKIFATIFIGYFLVSLIYSFRATGMIRDARNKLHLEFFDFEKELNHKVEEYTCYSTGHPYTWSQVTYAEKVNELMESIHWTRFLPHWTGPATYSIKKDEEKRFIYIVSGEDDYDWTSLLHYEEWLESNKDVALAIRKYKSNT